MRMLRYPGIPMEDIIDDHPGIGVGLDLLFARPLHLATTQTCTDDRLIQVTFSPMRTNPMLTQDFECFTILAQGGPGLQVKNRKGECECVPTKVLPFRALESPFRTGRLCCTSYF